jgi:Tfp pilus assembly protein PilF
LRSLNRKRKEGAPTNKRLPLSVSVRYNVEHRMNRVCHSSAFFPTLAMGICVWSGTAQTPVQPDVVKQHLQVGAEALQRGDAAAAESNFQRVVAAAPMLADGYLGLGMAQLREGKPEDASRALQRAAQLNPQLPGVQLFLGIAQYQTGQPEQALRSLQAELDLQPSNLEALLWMGIIQSDTGHPEEAVSALDQAIALDPKNKEALYYTARAHRLLAEAAYKKLYALDPDSALLHRALAETFAEAGEPEKSIDEYKAAIRKEPKNPDLYEALGEQEQKLGHVDAATEAYEQELHLHPNSAIALYNLGMMQVKTGRAATGVPLLRRAIEAHSMPAPTDFYLGWGLAELGENEEAAHWLELALQNSPSPFIEQSAYYQLLRVYQKLNRKVEADHALDQLKQLKAKAAKSMTGGEGTSPEEASGAGAPPI